MNVNGEHSNLVRINGEHSNLVRIMTPQRLFANINLVMQPGAYINEPLPFAEGMSHYPTTFKHNPSFWGIY